MKLSKTTEQAIQEDSRKVKLWKRDTEEIIKMLETRKKEIKYGEWGKYLEGIGMPRTTAYNLLSRINEVSNVPNGTSEDYGTKGEISLTENDEAGNIGPHTSPPAKISDLNIGTFEPPKGASEMIDIRQDQKIQDIEYQEIERDKEIKGMPDEYHIICHILEQPDMEGYCMERKLQLEKQYDNKFPEWRKFFEIHERLFNEKPNIMPRHRRDAKSIIQYLRGIGEGDALANWEAIISNWHKLDDFQQKRKDLTKILLDLNGIIDQLTAKKINKFDTPAMREYLGL